MKLNQIYILIFTFILTGCYVTKTLDREVHVILEENFSLSIVNNGNSTFTNAGSAEEYKAKFIDGVKSEFSSSKIIPDGVNPEFRIEIKKLTITESTSIETVNDTTSDQNGQSFELTKLEYNANGIVIRLSDNAEFAWNASKDKEEKVTSNRSVIQLATGQNKEQNVYREKDFSDDEALSTTWHIGRRSGQSTVKEIIKALK